MKETVLARKTTESSRDERKEYSKDFNIIKAPTEQGSYYRIQGLISSQGAGEGPLRQEGHSCSSLALSKQ